jgi:hypothetical protein
MLIKDLIKCIEDLYYTYDDEYKHHIGEPEIMVDIFKETDIRHKYEYVGFSPFIHIDKSADGVYDIIRAFDTEEDKEQWIKNHLKS